MNIAEKNMENKTRFLTFVKKDHKFGRNNFVLGRLVGYQQLICEGLLVLDEIIDEPPHGFGRIKEGTVLVCDCTPEQYDIFTILVKRDFPEDLCIFDWHDKTIE